MSQHTFQIPDESGAAFLPDLNNGLQALASRSSGTSAPATTYAFQLWADTSNVVLKQRNAANSGWIIRDALSETLVASRASNTLLWLGDYGCTFIATGTFTQTITAAATLGDGWYVFYRNDGSGVITLDPNASETIDGATTIDLQPGQSCRIACNGNAFKTQGLTPSVITNSIGADVNLNNTSNYFDGPTVAQGTLGTWFASGTVSLAAVVNSNFRVKLWDGTTVIASATMSGLGSGLTQCISLSGYIRNPVGNVRLSVSDTVATTSKILFNSTGMSKDSTITAIRVG